MPGLDGTGPWGEGPMTGGGRGYCNPALRGCGPAWGWGYGRGRGRGFRRGFWPGFGWGRGYGRGFGRPGFSSWEEWYGPAYGGPYVMDPKDEAEMLRNEADAMKNELDAIKKRIEELETQASES